MWTIQLGQGTAKLVVKALCQSPDRPHPNYNADSIVLAADWKAIIRQIVPTIGNEGQADKN
jgi:hypothetical protein